MRTKCSDLVAPKDDPERVIAKPSIEQHNDEDEKWSLMRQDPRTLAVDLRRRMIDTLLEIRVIDVFTGRSNS